jgi:hypothetical protein
MRLPNADRAVVKIQKLTEYSLNPWHDAGKHKARVFRAALAITVDDAEWLREQILESIREVEASPGGISVFGEKYVVVFCSRKAKGRQLCELPG